MREAEQLQHRNIMLPMFDLTDIGMMDARAGREGWLRQASLLAVLTEGSPQELQGGQVRGRRLRSRLAVGHRSIPSCGNRPEPQCGRRRSERVERCVVRSLAS